MASISSGEIIDRLQLARHPEGGYYREVYRSPCSVGQPDGFAGPRVAFTSIYFLLEADDFSAWHRVRGEEVWIHLGGAPLELITLDTQLRVWSLSEAAHGGTPLHVVPAGVLQAAHSRGEWSLASCFVAPGFEFADFEMPDRRELLERFTHLEEWILRFSRSTR